MVNSSTEQFFNISDWNKLSEVSDWSDLTKIMETNNDGPSQDKTPKPPKQTPAKPSPMKQQKDGTANKGNYLKRLDYAHFLYCCRPPDPEIRK